MPLPQPFSPSQRQLPFAKPNDPFRGMCMPGVFNGGGGGMTPSMNQPFTPPYWGEWIAALTAGAHPSSAPLLVNCLELPMFVRSIGAGGASVALFQIPDLAKVNGTEAVKQFGLRALYEPLARFLQQGLDLPVVDFNVGHHNFKFRPNVGNPQGNAGVHRSAGEPLEGWKSILEKHFTQCVSDFGVGVRERRDGSLHVVSAAFVGWDKHRAQKEMTAAFDAHFRAHFPQLPPQTTYGYAAVESDKIGVSVNPPTMQLRTKSKDDADVIVRFFAENAILCDFDLNVWVERGRFVIPIAIERALKDFQFRRALTQANLPRGLMNAEHRDATGEDAANEEAMWNEPIPPSSGFAQFSVLAQSSPSSAMGSRQTSSTSTFTPSVSSGSWIPPSAENPFGLYVPSHQGSASLKGAPPSLPTLPRHEDCTVKGTSSKQSKASASLKAQPDGLSEEQRRAIDCLLEDMDNDTDDTAGGVPPGTLLDVKSSTDTTGAGASNADAAILQRPEGTPTSASGSPFSVGDFGSLLSVQASVGSVRAPTNPMAPSTVPFAAPKQTQAAVPQPSLTPPASAGATPPIVGDASLSMLLGLAQQSNFAMSGIGGFGAMSQLANAMSAFGGINSNALLSIPGVIPVMVPLTVNGSVMFLPQYVHVSSLLGPMIGGPFGATMIQPDGVAAAVAAMLAGGQSSSAANATPAANTSASSADGSQQQPSPDAEREKVISNA